MPIRNINKLLRTEGKSHDGEGLVRGVEIFGSKDFSSSLRFLHDTILPPGVSIGVHTHGNNEEVYIILTGIGSMVCDGQTVLYGTATAAVGIVS